jgi:hypothetical protein
MHVSHTAYEDAGGQYWGAQPVLEANIDAKKWRQPPNPDSVGGFFRVMVGGDIVAGG